MLRQMCASVVVVQTLVKNGECHRKRGKRGVHCARGKMRRAAVVRCISPCSMRPTDPRLRRHSGFCATRTRRSAIRLPRRTNARPFRRRSATLRKPIRRRRPHLEGPAARLSRALGGTDRGLFGGRKVPPKGACFARHIGHRLISLHRFRAQGRWRDPAPSLRRRSRALRRRTNPALQTIAR